MVFVWRRGEIGNGGGLLAFIRGVWEGGLGWTGGKLVGGEKNWKKKASVKGFVSE